MMRRFLEITFIYLTLVTFASAQTATTLPSHHAKAHHTATLPSQHAPETSFSPGFNLSAPAKMGFSGGTTGLPLSIPTLLNHVSPCSIRGLPPACITPQNVQDIIGGLANGSLYSTSLTDGATIPVDATQGAFFNVTLGDSGHVISNPTGSTVNQMMTFIITQPAVGGPYTLSFGTAYKTTTGVSFVPSLNQGASATTIVECLVVAAAPTLQCWQPLVTSPGYAVQPAALYGAYPGIYKHDGQINAGCSTGPTDLCRPSGNFSTLGVQAGWYVIVFGAGPAGGTLAGGQVVSVSGTHLTLTTGASTPIASGATYVVAPDSSAALTAAANNANGFAIHIPAGPYCVVSQITQVPSGQQTTLSSKSVVTLFGDGIGQTNLYACGHMTTPVTNEAVFYRNSDFGIGGGLSGLTIDAAGLANESVLQAGNSNALYTSVWAKNAIVADWQCGDGVHGASGNNFININGSTDSNFFSSAQEAQYNFYITAPGCTDTYVGFSRFSNASVANIFDSNSSGGNHYASNHPFNTPGYTPPYQVRLGGEDTVYDTELDGGGTTAAIYSVGNNDMIMANWAFFNAGYTSGDIVLLASGVKNNYVTGNYARFSDGVPGGNVIATLGTPGTGTIIIGNPGATYGFPGVSCNAAPDASFKTTVDGLVSGC